MTDPASFPVVVTATVLWSDMDLYGHVNNAVFFRWFELARMEYLARCGFVASYDRDGVGAILHSTSCRFRKPVFHPDTVEVGTRARDVGADRFTMDYVVWGGAPRAMVAEGSCVVVSYDYRRNQKTEVPPAVRASIEKLERSVR